MALLLLRNVGLPVLERHINLYFFSLLSKEFKNQSSQVATLILTPRHL